MSTRIVSRFTESARKSVDSCTQTTPENFSATIAEHLVEPVVGAPLTSDRVDLEDTPVDIEPSVAALDRAATGVVQAGTGIADYGTITVESRPEGDEVVSLYPPRHLVVLDAADIVPDLISAFDRFEQSIHDARSDETAGASRILATGPSATADMGELVEGVHGPKEVHLVVVVDQ